MTDPDEVLDEADPGDDVAERFNYQHCYAAINAIRLITDQANVSEIICENHEDILVKKSIGLFVGTQIKTRALGQPRFKASDIQIRSALGKFCLLNSRFPGSFDGFDFTTNHAFWEESESANNLPWILKGLRERGGIKGLHRSNPLREFVLDIASDTALDPLDVIAALKKTVLRAHESDIISIRGHVREALTECPGVRELPYFTVVQIADAIIALARSASMKTLSGPIAEEGQAVVNGLSEAIASKAEAISEINMRLTEQESLIAEFIAMKFKLVRSSTAFELLKGADFEACPACGTELAPKPDGIHCLLCKPSLDHAPRGFASDSAVMERDLSDRIDDLKRSVQRLRRSQEKQHGALDELTKKRADAQMRVDSLRKQVESEYMKRARVLEGRCGAIKERRSLFVRIKGMPGEVEAKRREADQLSARIAELDRDIQTEQGRFEDGRRNVRALEHNFHRLLKAIHFPEITEDDRIFLNQRTWFPYVHPKGNENLAWTFSDAGSGGKMVLFKICFALALHLTAAEYSLPIPRVLVVDSPMKNITPDINPEIFIHFYQELYRLLANELDDWQCIVIDQTYFEPPIDFEDDTHRLLRKNDPNYPPLISYYHGH